MTDAPQLHSADTALLRAARTGEGAIVVTPAMLTKMQATIAARRAEIEAEYGALVDACPYETKLAVAAWVIGNIVDHAREPGSFRVLIYGRLGFGPDAYLPLYDAGGMTISNEFVLVEAGAPDIALAKRLEDSLRPDRDGAPIVMAGGAEPWMTVCEAIERIRDLSRALADEQEKRHRVERELDALRAPPAAAATRDRP